MISNNLRSEERISKSIELLENQIQVTDFLTTEQKNSFIDNIYLNIYNIEQNIISEKNFLALSNAVKNLIKKDPYIYNALIWNAKIMDIEKVKQEKIYDQIDLAIKLSPASPEAYRFAIDFSNKVNDKKKFEKYCNDFHNSFLGSKSIINRISKFSETSLTRFAIQIKDKEIQKYIVEGVSFNSTQDYFIDFKKPVLLSEFTFFSNFFPGTLIKPIEIELRNFENKSFKINLEDIFITTKKSFFINKNNSSEILVNSFNDELINFKLSRSYKSINQLKIKINFSKANFTNKPNC